MIQQQQDPIEEDSNKILRKSRGLSQRVGTYCNRLVGESDSLAEEIRSLQQAITALEKAANEHQDEMVRHETLASLEEARAVIQGVGPGGDMRKFCRSRHPTLLRLLLGDKVSVVAFRGDHSAAMKEEYHKFRDRSALVMLVVPLALLMGLKRANALRHEDGCFQPGDTSYNCAFSEYSFTPGVMTGVQLYFLWLGYFYLALALRENVLLVNGSHIKSWWIQHHYWSAGCSLLVLGLPVYSQAVNMFAQSFMLWSCFQAVVMIFQNMYQRKRMYTRIALGKNSAMDVVAGESSGMRGQLLVLYPLLFALQLTQFAIGAMVGYQTFPAFLAREGWFDVESQGSDLRGMRGVCLVGCAFCYMAIRNFQATIRTILEKRKSVSQKMLRTKIKSNANLAQSQSS